jgi:hypothetical protein
MESGPTIRLIGLRIEINVVCIDILTGSYILTLVVDPLIKLERLSDFDITILCFYSINQFHIFKRIHHYLTLPIVQLLVTNSNKIVTKIKPKVISDNILCSKLRKLSDFNLILHQNRTPLKVCISCIFIIFHEHIVFLDVKPQVLVSLQS